MYSDAIFHGKVGYFHKIVIEDDIGRKKLIECMVIRSGMSQQGRTIKASFFQFIN
jgi:hypothetical protein